MRRVTKTDGTRPTGAAPVRSSDGQTQIAETFAELDEERQEQLLAYAREQLAEQQSDR